MALELSFLTLNVWGIPYVSHDRDVRISAIGDALAKSRYDIVALQEVWSKKDFERLSEKLVEVLPYAHYFYSGVVGSGVCFFSKWPIMSAFFHAWSVNGYVHRVQHGDWFGGKGVGMCKINWKGRLVNVYTAHLHAEYNRECDDYMAHRVIQAFDTAQFIESTRGNACLQILGGDLNIEPGDIAQRLLLSTSHLADTYSTYSHLNLGTNECANNSYTSTATRAKLPNGKRIDYILIRPGDQFDVRVVDYKHPLSGPVPGADFSYSDHEAVAVRLQVEEKSPSDMNCYLNSFRVDMVDVKTDMPSGMSVTETSAILAESIKICEDSLKNLNSHRHHYLIIAVSVFVFLLNFLDFQVPYGMRTILVVAQLAVCFFCVFMATLWNEMERNGILSGKLAMEIVWNRLEKLK